MDIISAIFTILIWVFIGSAVKNAKRKNDSRKQPPRNMQQQAAAPKPITQPTVQKPAAAVAKDPETTRREARAKFEKTKSAYTPVTLPKMEGEGSDVSNKGHTVQPSFAPGAHAHEETSISGFKPCPPEKAPVIKNPAPKPAPAPATAFAPAPAPAVSYAFTKEEAIRAIVYSEILAKPKALR